MKKTIQLAFQGYWHVGSGQGAGYHLDATCLKDHNDLPYLSGKQLKGLLRHAVHRAEAWGWYADLALVEGEIKSFEELLFGSRNQLEGRHETVSGMLFVDNAQLSDPEYQYLAQNDQVNLKNYLYQELYSTAISIDTGTAVEHSLRGLEVTLPMTLFADLELKITVFDEGIRNQQQTLSKTHAWDIITKALPLVDAVGAHRSRGLGEVIVDWA